MMTETTPRESRLAADVKSGYALAQKFERAFLLKLVAREHEKSAAQPFQPA